MFTNRFPGGAAYLRARAPSILRAFFCATLAFCPAASALSIGWNANPEADIASYQLRYGTTSGTYPNLIDAGNNTIAPVPDLTEGETYYFVVIAVNAAGLSSAPSAEISYTVPTSTTVNQPPVANASSATTLEDSPASIALSASDADNEPLSYTVTGNPNKGSLTGTAPNLTYTPAANANGADSFTFTVSDGKATSSTATVSLTITPVNDAPVAIAKSVSTDEKVPVSMTLTATDVDGGVLTYSVVTQPSSGALSGTAPKLTYTPNAGFSGTDSFTFKARDANLDSKTVKVTLTVNKTTLPENPKLLARTGWKIIHVDSQDAIDNPASLAIDGDPATFWHTLWKSGATPLPHEIRIDLGAVRSLEGFRYLPRQDGFFVGNIGQYQFRTSLDGIHWSSAANGTFTNDNDEKEALFSTRNARFVSLTAISDASGSIHTCIAELNILGARAVNSAPLAKSASVTTVQKTARPITLEASDGEENPLVFTILSSPSNGTLTGTAPELTYTPDASFTGTDSFTYQVSDGKLTSDTATITITVKPKGSGRENRPPAFKSNPITRAAGFVGEPYKATSLTESADDPDKGDNITFSKISGPEWLDITPSGKLHGTPPAGSKGSQSFTIRATDKAGATDETILLIEIKTAELPLPWDFKALGNSGEKASAVFNARAFTLTAAGDLSGDDDAGSFVWQTLSGDGQITARIRDLDDAGKSTRAGLMIRDSLAANSKQVFIGVNGNDDFRWIRRTHTGDESMMKSTGKGRKPSTWLGLFRRGDTITTYRSENGKNWTKIGTSQAEFGKNCYIGLYVSSGSTDTSSATFRSVKLKP
jgi:hypothetical protein